MNGLFPPGDNQQTLLLDHVRGHSNANANLPMTYDPMASPRVI